MDAHLEERLWKVVDAARAHCSASRWESAKTLSDLRLSVMYLERPPKDKEHKEART